MGKFEHTFANSENPDEASHQDFYLSFSLFIFYSNNLNMKETRSLSEFSRLFAFTLLYHNLFFNLCVRSERRTIVINFSTGISITLKYTLVIKQVGEKR